MSDANCENCSFRAKYDNNPKSILGKLWRWHINWCPGWKSYMQTVPAEKKNELMVKYKIN
ncbi:MAG: hypothetical protein P8X42_01350 [Calditrichaceae bacterium]